MPEPNFDPPVCKAGGEDFFNTTFLKVKISVLTKPVYAAKQISGQVSWLYSLDHILYNKA